MGNELLPVEISHDMRSRRQFPKPMEFFCPGIDTIYISTIADRHNYFRCAGCTVQYIHLYNMYNAFFFFF